MKYYKCHQYQGFSLLEMAIVLLIAGLLLGGGLGVVASRQEAQRIQETETLLNEARDALIGYAATNGRLPCPASSTSNGIESPVGGGVCTNPYKDGYLPAVTLGLSGVDDEGYLRDGWQLKANRIRYAVTTANNTNAATTAITSTLASDLYICNSSIGMTSTNCGTAQTLSSNAVAVVFSLGKNASQTATSKDEKANVSNNAIFVSHSPSKAGTANPGGEFDDQVIWLSPNILFNRMIQAGKLP